MRDHIHDAAPRSTEERLTILEDRFDREVAAGGKAMDDLQRRLARVDDAVALLPWRIGRLLLAVAVAAAGGIVWAVRVGVVAERTDVDLASHLREAQTLTQDYVATRGQVRALADRVDRLEE